MTTDNSEGMSGTHLLLVVQIYDGVGMVSVYGHGDGCGIMQIRWTAATTTTTAADGMNLMLTGRLQWLLLLLLRQRVGRR